MVMKWSWNYICFLIQSLKSTNESLNSELSSINKQVENNAKWKLVKSVTGTAEVSFPALYNEIMIVISISDNYFGSSVFNKDCLPTSYRFAFIGSFYERTTSYMKQCVYIRKSSVKIQAILLSDTDYTNNASLKVYYR